MLERRAEAPRPGEPGGESERAKAKAAASGVEQRRTRKTHR
jgi:hypothetical protein